MPLPDFPGAVDVLPRLMEAHDRPTASYLNRLAAGLQAVQVLMGRNPNNAGGANYPHNDTVAALLERLGASVEFGKFDMTYPMSSTTATLDIAFTNPSRFTDPERVIVLIAPSISGDDVQITEDWSWAVMITESGGAPTGFSFWRSGQTSTSLSSETYFYFAFEDRN